MFFVLSVSPWFGLNSGVRSDHGLHKFHGYRRERCVRAYPLDCADKISCTAAPVGLTYSVADSVVRSAWPLDWLNSSSIAGLEKVAPSLSGTTVCPAPA